jgi:NDP-sugar pyrophosphorylase family protein
MTPVEGVQAAAAGGGTLRAMILAAGLGTRMRPLSSLRAKPALPVRGRPVISLLLALLSRHGIREVLINLHHRPESIREAVERDCPADMDITWSEEPVPLGTGGGIARAAEFLREADDCLVMAGDMLLDVDLTALHARHRASAHDVTLVLRDDPRIASFGSIGLDAEGCVLRIGERRIAGSGPGGATSETRAGLFTSLRFFRREALAGWPETPGTAFEDLRDWLVPRVARQALRLGGVLLPAEDCVWEPVGTPAEYLAVNLDPPTLPGLGGAAERWSGPLRTDLGRDCVIAAHSEVPPDVDLARCIVWDREQLPAGFRARDGVYAGNRFHPCGGEERVPRAETETHAAGVGAWKETASGSSL